MDLSNAADVVVIVTDNGPVRINKSDYDPKQHTLHQANETHDANGVLINQPKSASEFPTIAEGMAISSPVVPRELTEMDRRIIAANLGVMQDNKRFYIIEGNEKVTNIDGIDPNGYKTNKLAWEALLAVKNRATEAEKAANEAAEKAAS